jgi:LemA protein
MSAGVIVGIVFGVLLLLAIGFILWVVGIYNALITLRNAVKNAWAQIEVQLKRRHDLIPNLVETVKGYAAHEHQTLQDVIQARNMAVSAVGKSIDTQMKAEGQLSQALGRLLLLQEAYPNLKANENFIALQEELTKTEHAIAFARQAYNEGVLQYNNQVQMFPSNIIAGMFHFALEKFFEVEDPKERNVPKVDFTGTRKD